MARRLRTLTVLTVIAAVVAGCGGQAVAPSTAVRTVRDGRGARFGVGRAVTDRVRGRQPDGRRGAVADLDYLVERLKAIHRNPFLDEGEAAFMARVAAVEAKAGSMSDAGFLVAVMGLMGHRERDGHSGAWAMAQAGTVLSAWPIWLWDFPDGLRIVAARAPYDGLVGARRHEGRPRAGRRCARRRRPARAARQRVDAARQPADLPHPPERAGRARACSPRATRG